MRKIAIIPARGGSKRLPRKNIIDFMGKPIIAYTIGYADETGLFDKVIVSTEDEEIAGIATRYGADVIFRPPELATDESGVVDVCLHVLDEEKKAGWSNEIMCCLYATSPLRNSDDIRKTMQPVVERECDFAIAVTRYHFSPHQALKYGEKGLLEPVWPELIMKKSQEVPDFFVDNGSTYAVYVPEFLRLKSFYGSGVVGHVMPRFRSVDIDEEEDLIIAMHYAGVSKR